MNSTVLMHILAIAAGLFSVPVVSLLKNVEWVQKLKATLAAGVALLFSAGIVLPIELSDAGSPAWPGLVPAIVFAVSQVFYKLVFEGTSAERKLALSLVKPKRQANENLPVRPDHQVITPRNDLDA